MPILTQPDLEHLFGDFSWHDDPKRKGAVIVSPEWIAANLARITPPFPLHDGLGRPIRLIAVHHLIAPRLEALLADLHRSHLEHLLGTWDGCWCARHTRWKPGKPLSHHAWAIALDINARAYPYGSHHRQDQRLIDLFALHGFLWGGDWHTPDPMHFEISAAAAGHDHRALSS